MNKPEIVISAQDFDLISDLLDKNRSSKEHVNLSEEIDRAKVVDKKELPKNVVSINSTVKFVIEATHKEFTYKLVAPKKDLAATEISILSPIGTAIFGLTVGQTIEWPMNTGKKVTVRIVDVAESPIAINVN